MPEWRERRRDHTTSLELWEVLAEEFEEYGGSLPPSFDVLAQAAIEARGHEAEASTGEAVRQEIFRLMGMEPRTALCISGGGVRSATFGLGVIQGLGTCSLLGCTALSQFDFLSTVSGGGYVGSWFSAWAKRRESAGAADGPRQVEFEMQQRGASLDPDPAPLRHIREYCAFLTPKLGLLSADSWTLASTILRNMALNWMILIPLIAAGLLLPKLYRALLWQTDFIWVQALLYAGTAMAVFGTSYVASHLPTFSGGVRDGETKFFFAALLPLTLAAIALSLHWHLMHRYTKGPHWNYFDRGWNYTWAQFLLFGAAVHAAGWLVGIGVLLSRKKLRESARQLPAMLAGALAATISGVAAGVFAKLVSDTFNERFPAIVHRSPLAQADVTRLHQFNNWYACLGAPAVLIAFLAATLLVVALVSKKTGDDDREWWARAGAWIMIVVAAWLAATSTVLLGPDLLRGWVSEISTSLGCVGLGGLASWFGFSPSTGTGRRRDKDMQSQESHPLKDMAAKLAAPAFLWVLMVTLAAANQHFLTWLPARSAASKEVCLLAIFVAILIVSSLFINVNRFSLHAMYRDRLIRTYLGASRPNRAQSVNPFTDFDEEDNLNLADLSRARPLHVINMALNLVGGNNLAWQQRKAESFTASRLRTGSLRVGYQSTRYYGGKKRGGTEGLSLGSAVAISGAAASPNMGYHSSPFITLIMTLFNARLGWWLANPGGPGKGFWNKDGPSFAVQPFLDEALGRTNDTRKWVYLSDGGHFENLGLYEMVLRRCQRIVVVDGSQDTDYNFEDLGNAIRKIRVDLGISVEFPRGIPIFSATDLQNRYCAVAEIHYEKKDPATPCGKLLYIKACLNGTEHEDVLHYAALNPDFPQQGTDQLWFDESQFESYRRLGLHVMEEICRAAPADANGGAIDRLIAAAEAYIESKPTVQYTNWPKTPHFVGGISGKLGDSVDLKVDFQTD